MNFFLLKIITFFVSLSVLFSTFSFSVDKHYCGNFLVDISYFGNAKSCKMNSKEVTVAKKKCCSNIIENIQGQDLLQLEPVVVFNFYDAFTFDVGINMYCNTVYDFKSKKHQKTAFPPPEITPNFKVLYQQFLI